LTVLLSLEDDEDEKKEIVFGEEEGKGDVDFTT